MRLDLYQGVQARRAGDVPEKDARRPGLALLTQQGKEYERAKFRELEEIFPDLVVRGTLRPFQAEEDRAFDTIELGSVIDDLGANQMALEAQFTVTQAFKAAHELLELENGAAIPGSYPLTFDSLRPDIIRVQAPTGQPRRVVTPSGTIEQIAAADQRLGLRIIDIKISGEPSPSHFAELAYYGMTLAGWLQDTCRADRFIVLAEAAIWPGAHDGSTMHRYLLQDRAAGLPVLALERYLGGLDADLENMPPEVVLGRVQRFLRVDLREVLAEPNWRSLPWHIDNRCSGCDYLGYRWSRHDSEAAEDGGSDDVIDQRYCWPMAEATQHLSRVAGLTEGACGKLREVAVVDVAAVSALSAGSVAFEQHQTLRAKRTVLRARALTLRNSTPAEIPDRAGTSAVLPRFADIRVSLSADFDVGSGITFALGYRIDYGVPNASRPNGTAGPRFRREFGHIERPMLVLERALHSEGAILRDWLDLLVRDILRLQQDILAGYRAQGDTDRTDVTLQFFLWDRLTFDHLCRVIGRHLDLLQAPIRVGQVDVSPISWVFPADTVLEEADFVSRSSPITILSDAVNGLMAAPIPHHYSVIDLANSLDPQTRNLPNGGRWHFHVNKFYRDPLSDQIPSERGHEVWERASPFRDQDFQWHQEEMRKVVKRKLHAASYVAEKLTRMLADDLSARAPEVNAVFQPADRLTGVGDDGQIFYQHARLMAAAQRLEVDLLMAMPPHEREARFRSARVEAVLQGADRREGLVRLGLVSRVGDPVVLLFRLSPRSREARLKEGEYTWSFLPEADLPGLQEMTVAQFKMQNHQLEAALPFQQWDRGSKLRDELRVTILRVDRGACLLAVETSALLGHSLRLGLLQMDLDGAIGRFGILDPIAMDVFTRKVRRTLEEPSGIRNPPLAQQRPLFPTLAVARVRRGRARAGQLDSPAAEFIWNADALAAAETRLVADPILSVAERVCPGLTLRQRDAIARAVTRRLALWWGPPGTGKSRTAQAYITAISTQAVAEDRPLRIAITGFTWVAIDNVARRLPELLAVEGLTDQVHLARLCSSETYGGVDPLLAGRIMP
ncbi:MAG TPA: AAA domain-containing protein, partial [Dehalococcoidia bacterium]